MLHGQALAQKALYIAFIDSDGKIILAPNPTVIEQRSLLMLFEVTSTFPTIFTLRSDYGTTSAAIGVGRRSRLAADVAIRSGFRDSPITLGICTSV
jgi:hypothetical protein